MERYPSLFCGPKSKACKLATDNSWTTAAYPTAANLAATNRYIDGFNTMIENYQGQRYFDILKKLNDGVYDTDVNCENDLYGKLRYMFNA